MAAGDGEEVAVAMGAPSSVQWLQVYGLPPVRCGQEPNWEGADSEW